MTGNRAKRTIAALLPAVLLVLAFDLLRPEAGLAADPAGRQSLAVTGPLGSGRLALLVSRDWSRPQPDITRAVITIHGKRRDAARYHAIAREALARAMSVGGPASDRNTLLVTPRFAGAGETDPHILRWDDHGWMEGGLATLPAPLGSFEAIDAVIAWLSDRTRFPALSIIVLVGHSAGGQFVQRYAVLGHGKARATQAGISVRYLVANPSSYSYFTPDRPIAGGGYAPFPANRCPRFDRWKYGMQALPAYAGDAQPAELERAYMHRRVIYLLGALDTDPELPALDTSCAAEAQGATHLERGQDFFRYLQVRHPGDLHQALHVVPGVGHNPRGMLTSDCALATMFDAPLCGRVAGIHRPAALPPP